MHGPLLARCAAAGYGDDPGAVGCGATLDIEMHSLLLPGTSTLLVAHATKTKTMSPNKQTGLIMIFSP
jgi:hypothetical protein